MNKSEQERKEFIMRTSDQYTKQEWKNLSHDEKIAIKLFEATGKETFQSTKLEKLDSHESDAMLAFRQKVLDEVQYKKAQGANDFMTKLKDNFEGVKVEEKSTLLDQLNERSYDKKGDQE